jgi:tRNA U34 5-methylaminomethyl-2-thiouridine-forming methyltransferase MnmC
MLKKPMSLSPRIIRTADGSCTLYREDIDETYHSVHGALAESTHVYIENGLLALKEKKEIHILEIGFGTGLNALLTLDHAAEGQVIHYYSLEPFPVEGDTMLEYYNQFAIKPVSLPSLGKMIASGGLTVEIRPGFDFCLLDKTLQSLDQDDVDGLRFDLVYYDAFGPSKQADMWTFDTLNKAVDLMKTGGILTTYCSQGQFKRNLKELGMQVKNPKGPAGKREMTVGVKL